MTESHRNPRPRVPRRRTRTNPTEAAVRRRQASRRALRATFGRLAVENQRLARAVLTVLQIVAGADRQVATRLVDAVATIVIASPRQAPIPEQL